jgi:aminoglycoside/choline kinase family phosphotransferase
VDRQRAEQSTFALAPASADASFRRYFRVTPEGSWRGHATLIAMDAPPPMENCAPYLHVAGLLAEAGVHAPEILAADLERGFVLMTDLGRGRTSMRSTPHRHPRSTATRSRRSFAGRAPRAKMR